MFMVVGDIHGNVEALDRLEQLAMYYGLDKIYQAGDMGCPWPSGEDNARKWFRKREDNKRLWDNPQWITCGGNHENYDHWDAQLATWSPQHQGYQRMFPLLSQPGSETVTGLWAVVRGESLDLPGGRMAFCGGADSTDAEFRLEHERHHGKKIWWDQEWVRPEELERFKNTLLRTRCEYVLTHECPAFLNMWRDHGTNPNGRNTISTSQDFGQLWHELPDDHKPKYWFYGHHHHINVQKHGSTTFICTGIEGGGVLVNPDHDQYITFNARGRALKDVKAHIDSFLVW